MQTVLMPKAAHFLLAVTDAGKIERDSTQDHILSYLLLSSDIKGYIEDPAYYFRDGRVATRRYLGFADVDSRMDPF